MPAPTTLWHHARVATLCPGPGGTPDDGWGLIPHGAVLTQGDTIAWVGAMDALPPQAHAATVRRVDLGGALVTPGLVDCHTHLVYGGDRAAEFDMRLRGLSYEAIAQAGGGIRSTVQATRQATEAELLAQASRRLHALLAEGVTTVEIKSGYGLSLEAEARCLRVARTLGQQHRVSVRTTCLAAHALPPEYSAPTAGTPTDPRDAYIDTVCRDWLPQLHAQGLVDAVDAFCETIGFSPAQTQRVFQAAQALGLPVKLHAEQLSNQEGAALAARFGALSCDHLEHLSPAGVAAMAAAGTVAVLLPGAYYTLRDTHLPPIQALRDAGVPLAVSTDHNPGTSPALSLLLMVNMACTLFRLTPLEAVQGVTVHAARALGLTDRGRIAPGQRADLAVWSLDHPQQLAYWLGHNPCLRTVVAGEERP